MDNPKQASCSAIFPAWVKPWSQDWLIDARAYPSFCSMKRLEVPGISTSSGWDASPSQVTSPQFVRFPQQFASTHLHTWVERGAVRVKCLAQEQNSLMSLARAQTQTTHSESSALTMRPPCLLSCLGGKGSCGLASSLPTTKHAT